MKMPMSNGFHQKRPMRLGVFVVVVAFLGVFYVSQQCSSKVTVPREIEIVYPANYSPSCTWIFDHYSPSSWELSWYKNISQLQEKVCPTLSEPEEMAKSIYTIDRIVRFQSALYSTDNLTSQDKSVFSKLIYRYECANASTKSVPTVSQYIEPLIGLLRDPLTICNHLNIPSRLNLSAVEDEQSKRFFLLGPSAPYKNFRFASDLSIAPWLYPMGAKKILFDFGASLFNGQDHPTLATPTIGARWFYEYFKRLSLEFDRIIAFEYKEYSARTYWQQIPDDLLGKLIFINIGVEEQGKFNPWHIVELNAKKEDYVIVKLDIDSFGLEQNLMKQMVNNQSISSLVDEMFFEMHVTVKEMLKNWGGQPLVLKDSYDLFTQIRQMGIRMHSWP